MHGFIHTEKLGNGKAFGLAAPGFCLFFLAIIIWLQIVYIPTTKFVHDCNLFRHSLWIVHDTQLSFFHMLPLQVLLLPSLLLFGNALPPAYGP